MQGILLSVLGEVVITKCHKVGGLQTTEIYLSLFWRLEVQDQSASMIGFWLILGSILIVSSKGHFFVHTCRA